MRVEILRPFVCSTPAGSRELAPGDRFDVPDRLIAALTASGYVRPAEDLAIRPTIAPQMPANGPTVARAPIPAPALPKAPNPASEPAGAALSAEPLHVRHIGRGRYAIFRGDERLTHDAMTREQAEAALTRMV